MKDFKPGKFSGMMCSPGKCIGGDLYWHIPRPDPCTFTRYNGEVYKLDFEFENDVGSIPWFARWWPKLSKGYYAVAYLFHDMFYALRELGKPHPSFKESNQILGEIIVTLQNGGYFGQKTWKGGQRKAKLIVWATNSRVGRKAWKNALNRKAKKDD